MDSSSLTEIGINSKIFYSNMLFAKIIGQEIPDLYQRLSLVRSTSLAGEWIFASTAFPHKQKAHQYYGKRRFTPNVSVPMLSTSISYEDLLKCQSFVPE
ncbi:hypothetical protein, partial [Candidatus Hodarchaeum mangrovi]